MKLGEIILLYIGNILGAIAILLFVCSFQLKTRKEIIVLSTVSRLFYVLQYICLGAYTGAITDFVAGIISVFVVKPDKNYKKGIVFLLYIVIVISSIMLYKNFFSIFSFIAVTLEIIAIMFKKEKTVRIISLLAQPCWLIYNCYYMAWFSALGNFISIFSIVFALYRYDFKKIQKNTCN